MWPRTNQKRHNAPAMRSSRLGGSSVARPGERGVEVRVVVFQASEPERLLGTAELRRRLARRRRRGARRAVCCAASASPPARNRSRRVLADRVEQTRSASRCHHRGAGRSGSCRRSDYECVERRSRRPRRSAAAVQREAAGEDGEMPHARSARSFGSRSVVAPADRRPQRLLSGPGRSRAPPVSTGSTRWTNCDPSSNAAAGVPGTRAAASSIASGRPSSRRQISAHRRLVPVGASA